MTLEERLALAREIAARSRPRFVVDNSREEMRQKRFRGAKRRTEALKNRGHIHGQSNLEGLAEGRIGRCHADRATDIAEWRTVDHAHHPDTRSHTATRAKAP
jgi:hypothetical protein